MKELRQILYIFKDAYAVTRKITGRDYILEFPNTVTEQQLTTPSFLSSRISMFSLLCTTCLQTNPKEITLANLPDLQRRHSEIVKHRHELLKKDASKVQLLLRGESRFIALTPPVSTATVTDRQSSLLARIKAKEAARVLSQRKILSPADQKRYALLGRSCTQNGLVDLLMHMQRDKPTHLPLRKLVEMLRDSVRASGSVLGFEEAMQMVEAVEACVGEDLLRIVRMGAISSVRVAQAGMLSREDVVEKIRAERRKMDEL